MSQIQKSFTSGLKRGVMRASLGPLAHSGFARSHTVVAQPFAHSVQMLSTAVGLSHGRDLNR